MAAQQNGFVTAVQEKDPWLTIVAAPAGWPAHELGASAAEGHSSLPLN
ncbi:MAG TPA: hypothetical protein VF163_09065 [Micromonosporaceae bacterium]